MSNNKTPGTDGLTAEFYKYFRSDIEDVVVDNFNYGYQTGRFSISQRRGIISHIPKKNKNLEHLKNWRPLSLLNMDYKIATKAPASRLEKVLPSLIRSNQTGYIKGRYIGENIRLISDILHYIKHKNIPGFALFLDFEKAFDSIEWSFILKVLKVFNFGLQFISWIEVLYRDVSSCVINNGFATPFFRLNRGVRQGCPLSGLLFVLAIELLGNAIRQSQSISGIKIGPNEIKLSQYADDTTVFVSDIKSAENLVNLLKLSSECSGLKVNSSKSDVLCLGSERNVQERVLDFRPPKDFVYSHGVYFSHNSKVTDEKNFHSKLASLKSLLSMWKIRDLTLYGKIQIIKTLALPKIVFICSVLPSPVNFEKEINSLTFSFIWNNKPAKIKKNNLDRR